MMILLSADLIVPPPKKVIKSLPEPEEYPLASGKLQMEKEWKVYSRVATVTHIHFMISVIL